MEDFHYIKCFGGTIEDGIRWWLGEFWRYLLYNDPYNYVGIEYNCPKIILIAKNCNSSTEFKIKLDLIGYNYDNDKFISGIISLLDKYRHGKE